MKQRIKVLNLYAGIGGNRKLWTGCDVTAVEKDARLCAEYKRVFPRDTVLEGDAINYLVQHYSEFDFIWCSPPCQKHGRMNRIFKNKRLPDFSLYEQIVFLQEFFKGKYVVENVIPYYKYLINPKAVIGRHAFWSNFEIPNTSIVSPPKFIKLTGEKGRKVLNDWLGFDYQLSHKTETSHEPLQILRNCVHPEIGLAIYKAAFS